MQKTRLKLFKKELTSRGRLQFQRPRKLVWEYLQPDPSKLVLNQDRATLSSPGAAPQVFDLQRDGTLRAIFDQLLGWLSGPSNLDRDYVVAVHANALDLVPKSDSPAARAFQKISLRFDKAMLLQSITLTETNGDEKEITLLHLERNVPVEESAFR